MDRSFLNIVPAFKSSQDRDIKNLAKVYENANLLKELIQEATSPQFRDLRITGRRVLLKPNWVKHNRIESDELCMRTHDKFLLATLEIILQNGPVSVIVGDAPVQGCYWDRVVTPKLEKEITHLSKSFNIPVSIKDFRRVTFDPSRNNPNLERNPLSEYVITDLGKESYLESITEPDRQVFRVTNYNPDRFTESHRPGVHKYCITKELYNADIVISIPKVKTHQKAGITAALKNIVGLNGDKDFLPHHRLGGTGFGGDCYPGSSRLRYLSELAMDYANRHQGNWKYWIGQKTSSLLWRLSFPKPVHRMAAGWYGNDTTWRMVMDLNKVIRYGLPDGSISKVPQREFYSLCDGIIGGQGDGPLKPDPLPLGVISFTNNSALNDLAMVTLMGFDSRKIPLLVEAAKFIPGDYSLKFATLSMTWEELKRYKISTTPPPGWIGKL